MVPRVTQSARRIALVLAAFVCGCSSSPYGESSTEAEATRSPAMQGTPAVPPPILAAAPAGERVDYKRLANETHDFIIGNLLVPSSGSYRTTAGEDRTDEWHDVSQIGADVAMIALGDARYQPYVDATVGFMGKLWDHDSPAGGYFATSATDGSNVERSTKYVDDNALAGVISLDAYDTMADFGRRSGHLASARAIAGFLMQSAVWDDVYGGGFYWNTQKLDKPTQSNGLALQVFLRLAALTGESYYRDWAGSVLAWLDGRMFDERDGLYSWKWEAAGRNDAKFTYDQAIVIDAHLVLYAQTHDAKHLDRARSVANAMHGVLWDAANGGYVISTQDRRLSPVFSAWASCTLVRLFEADGDRTWLDRAAANVAALDAHLRDPVTHGYYAGSRPDGSERSGAIQMVDQAWMQRAQAMLAKH
jgi:hypothetical protein